MAILLLTGEVGQISARWPKSMNCHGLIVPHILPVGIAGCLGAELVGPCQGKDVILISYLSTGCIKSVVRGYSTSMTS